MPPLPPQPPPSFRWRWVLFLVQGFAMGAIAMACIYESRLPPKQIPVIMLGTGSGSFTVPAVPVQHINLVGIAIICIVLGVLNFGSFMFEHTKEKRAAETRR